MNDAIMYKAAWRCLQSYWIDTIGQYRYEMKSQFHKGHKDSIHMYNTNNEVLRNLLLMFARRCLGLFGPSL